MPARTIETLVSFSSEFWMPGLETPQPPGDYRVDDDEEPVEGLSWLAYRRVATFLHLPSIGSAGGVSQLVKVERSDLEAAERQDRDRRRAAGDAPA